MARSRSSLGDGDDCPVVPAHGAMLTVRGRQVQYCPDAYHDGLWTKESRTGQTPSRWPLGYKSFEQAVDRWRTVSSSDGMVVRTGDEPGLPSLDIDI